MHKHSKIDRIVCVSRKQQKQLNSLGITNVFVVNNGINFYNSVMRQNNNHNIITVASLTSDKNIDKTIFLFDVKSKIFILMDKKISFSFKKILLPFLHFIQ